MEVLKVKLLDARSIHLRRKDLLINHALTKVVVTAGFPDYSLFLVLGVGRRDGLEEIMIRQLLGVRTNYVR